MACEQIAFLARRGRKAVAPEGNVLNDRDKLRAYRKVRLNTRAEDDEVEFKGTGFGCNLRDAPLLANRLPRAIGMPCKILETATTPKGILGWRHRKLLQDVTHEPPALEIGQFSKVTEQAREVHPDKRIDPRECCPTKTEVDPTCAGFERNGGIVKRGSAGSEHANALSR